MDANRIAVATGVITLLLGGLVGYFIGFDHGFERAIREIFETERSYQESSDLYPAPREENRPIACTLEARICPDGSAVGRTGPRCEFAACPNE